MSNFQPLEVVDRDSETQLHVGEIYLMKNYFMKVFSCSALRDRPNLACLLNLYLLCLQRQLTGRLRTTRG